MGQARRANWLLAVALLSAAPLLLAGTDSDLHGTVLDKNGAPLPGVTLVLRNDTLAFAEKGIVTNSKGEYAFRHLPPGSGYRLAATLPLHATVEFTDVMLVSGVDTALDITLRPSSEATEYVRVKGTASVVDTESAVTSTRFSSEFIADLPILGRDYQDILVLAPGVTDPNKTGNPNIHGARDVDVVTLVDGVSTTDPFTGLYGQELNIESIQEIEVITSAATAQYSRAQGGFASILTKSGGNEFKGTFKMFLRSNRLDGDGAGVDPPDVSGGFPGASSLSELSFTDLKPYLSVSGAIIRDKLWYFATAEFIQEETPVNALREVFVYGTREYRGFLKGTWQMSAANKMALSIMADRQEDENQGIDSLRDVSSGYSSFRGGPTYTLKQSSVFHSQASLDSSVSWFDNRFGLTPTLDPDTNHNGILFVDDRPDLGGDGDGYLEPKERDPGEDWDADGYYDVFEDANYNRYLDTGEDLDRDGRLIYQYGCEGFEREDFNCNGLLDREMDSNLNGFPDPNEDIGIRCDIPGLCPEHVSPGTDGKSTAGNHRFDTEDQNGNGKLDTLRNSGVTPIPFWSDKNGDLKVELGEFSAPLPPDLDLTRDQHGRYFGPFPYDFHDHRKRASWVEDLSLYLPDIGGTHDLKAGFVYEHEGYESDTNRRPNLFYPVPGGPAAQIGVPADPSPPLPQVAAIVALPAQVLNSATGDNLGLYLQDTYKPIPNLTLGLGLRFDFEKVESFGYSPFDPVAERRSYDSLIQITAIDTNHFDGVVPQGLCRDPVHSCVGGGDLRVSQITSTLRQLAFQGMTRHNLDVDVFSRFLGAITGDTPINTAPARVRTPENFGITNNNLAPRLSLSWDPWADGKSKVFASWGRYYGKLFLNTAVLEQGPDTVSRSYVFDADGVSDRGLPNNRLGSVLSQSTLSASQVDRNLGTPYADEWTAGIERELAPELAVSLRYIQRDYKNQLQDVDANHHTMVDPATGELADNIGGSQCGNMGCQNVPDGLPDLYINNFFFNRIYRLGNYNDQEYHGWELVLTRRLHRKWQLEGSYTYSVAQGGAEGYLSAIGDDPSLTEWETGYLDYDQRHVIKLNATAYLPGNWRLGGTASWASGYPYSTRGTQASTDDVGFLQNRTLFGYLDADGFTFHREVRNNHRNPASYLFNVRLQKDFVMGKSSASGFFEIYNLLNTDDLRLFYLSEVPPYVQPARTPGGADVWVPGYMTPVGTRDFGRRFQVGIQISF